MSVLELETLNHDHEQFMDDIGRLRDVYIPRFHRSKEGIKAAQDLGRDKVQHFVKFIEEADDGRGFDAYFMLASSPMHVFQHEGFWDEISSNYPDMVIPETDDPLIRMYIFAEQGVYLLAEKQIIDTENRPVPHGIHPDGAIDLGADHGECFAIRYTAHRIDTTSKMGTVATAYLMQ